MAATQPKRRGRAATKDKVVHTRFSDDEYGAIRAAAEAADLTVSAFFRSLALEGAGVKPFLTEQDRAVIALLVGDMRTIGGNLNQVARALNGDRRTDLATVNESLRNVEAVTSATLYELRALAERGARKRRRGA